MKSIVEIEQYFKSRQSLGIRPGLERMNLLLKNLEHPEQNLRAIHIAGTNGKGSTVQLIANSLIANHYKVGIFSSPSFTGLPGHFLVDNEPICEQDLIKYVNEMLPIIEELDSRGEAPTEFEILTALAFLYFENRVDFALIEAGMGGRYDTTNCVNPILSVITSISLDHEQFLGEKLREIAHHKAGIIKKNRPVIIGPVTKEVTTVIKKEAELKGAPTFAFDHHYFIEEQDEKIMWRGPDGKKIEIKLQLQGRHQFENAAIALMALHYLADEWHYQIDWAKVTEALYKVSLPGRFEVLSESPTIIVDSAHNLAGIEAFIEVAKKQSTTENSRLIFAGFRDKNIDEMIQKLVEASFSVTLSTFKHERAAQEIEYAHLLQNDVKLTFNENWESEIDEFLHEATSEETLFVTGSLHFVSIVRQYIKQVVATYSSRS